MSDSQPTKAVVIRLAGPLQSWADTKLSGNFSYTADRPTRRGLEGLTAAALGLQRGVRPDWFDELQFNIECVKPGEIVDEFHTINPVTTPFRYRTMSLLRSKAMSQKNAIFTPDGQSSTAVVRRTFLADAEFIVTISGTKSENLDLLAEAFARPKFMLYLGRKAFSPAFPFFLGARK